MSRNGDLADARLCRYVVGDGRWLERGATGRSCGREHSRRRRVLHGPSTWSFAASGPSGARSAVRRGAVSDTPSDAAPWRAVSDAIDAAPYRAVRASTQAPRRREKREAPRLRRRRFSRGSRGLRRARRARPEPPTSAAHRARHENSFNEGGTLFWPSRRVHGGC